MGNEKQVLEIPYGTRDYLPGEATGKRAIETQLARLFALWGYDEVVTPTIEYLDTLTMDSGRSLSPQLFKLFDKGGRTLALRHEMTTPIARVVGSRLKDAPLPLKLSYISSVFRSEQSQMGRQCEFYQAGVELIGSASAAADAEVLALSIQSLLRSGLKKFQVCLGQVEFAAGIMEQYRISEDDQQTLKDALEQHDLVAYDAAIDELPLAAAAKKNLRQLPVLSGGEEVLTKAYSLALGESRARRKEPPRTRQSQCGLSPARGVWRRAVRAVRSRPHPRFQLLYGHGFRGLHGRARLSTCGRRPL